MRPAERATASACQQRLYVVSARLADFDVRDAPSDSHDPPCARAAKPVATRGVQDGPPADGRRT